jgi:peptidoglycan DL-endopeptidase CwlO
MRRSVLMVMIVVAAIAVSAGTSSVAYAASYPTWSDVQAAKASQAATQAEVDKINALLAGLQTTANQDSVIAIQRAAEYAEAETKLQAATARATALANQAAAAAASATALRNRSGKLTEQLSRAGGSGLTATILLSGKNATGLLYRLGEVSKLSDQAAALFKQATIESNTARAVSAQAEVARADRDTLATAAETSLKAAQAAQQAVDAELATQQAASQVLYAQLASLKNTTAAVEQQYAVGVAAAAEAQERNGGPANGFAPPLGITPNPAAAQAYASSAIGAYGWGGDQMSCLIRLWNQESGWRLDAYNTSSGAYGIPQSLPATKMATAGADWETNADTQINWGLNYISRAYGSPCGAWAHEVSHNWY